MNFFSVLGNRIKTANPHHFAIFKGMASVALFVMIGKVMSAAKEMAVAYRYGLGAEVDAYQFIFNLIGWPVGVWTSVLTAVLVPLVARIRQSDEAGLRKFRSELLGFAVGLGILIAVISWVAISVMLKQGWSGLPQNTVQIALRALPGLALLAPLGVLIALQSAWMLSAGRHVNTLLDSVPTVFIALAVILFVQGGIEPLVWGTVVGAVFHLLFLLVPMVKRQEIEPPSFVRRSSHWAGFWQGFGIMMVGQALLSFTVIVDQFFAGNLGAGSIATLGYANRILSLILGLGAVAVSRATLPVFSQAKLDGGERMREVAAHWAKTMFLVGLATMAVGYWLAPWAVKLLFERGAFTTSDTQVVAEVLRYGLLQLPFYFASAVLSSYALSQFRFAAIFWPGVIAIISKTLTNLLVVPHLGINGIAAASAVMSACITLYLWTALGISKGKS